MRSIYYRAYKSVLFDYCIGPIELNDAIDAQYQIKSERIAFKLALEDFDMSASIFNAFIEMIENYDKSILACNSMSADLNADNILNRLDGNVFTLDYDDGIQYKILPSNGVGDYIRLGMRRVSELSLAFASLAEFVAKKTNDYTEIAKFHIYLASLDKHYDAEPWVTNAVNKNFFIVNEKAIRVL